MRYPFVFLEPWVSVSDEANYLELELRKELSSQHPLFGLKTRAIARRIDCDDALFEVESNAIPLALVHLTRSGKQENGPEWPHTRLFENIEGFIKSCMTPDHQTDISET
jgi:hypothetical protein